MNKEIWTEDILQSAKAIQKVAANPYMALRIEAKLQQQTTVVSNVSLRWVYSVAAGLLLLLFINITAWRQWSRNSDKSDGLQQVIREYGWNTNDLYPANLQNSHYE